MHSPRKTRSTNATQHPGLVVKSSKRRTPAEVKAANEAKEAAKEAKRQAKEASINRAAEFESNAMANEDFLDATPRPNFNPRPSTPTETETSNDIEMSDGPEFDNNPYIPPEDPTEDDSMGSEGSAEETPMPLSKKRKTATTAFKRVALARSFAVADLAAEAPPKQGQPKSRDTSKHQPKSGVVDHDTLPANITDSSDTENDDQPPRKKARAKVTAGQSVETTGAATESDGAPLLSKAKVVEKTKKKKESVREAIEAARGKTMERIDSNSRNRDNASRSKLDTKEKSVKVVIKSQLKAKPKSEPIRFGNGPQWMPKDSEDSKGKEQGGVDRVGKRTTDLSKDRASIKSSNQAVIDIESDDEQVPEKAMRRVSFLFLHRNHAESRSLYSLLLES
jgi:hypothetical protein